MELIISKTNWKEEQLTHTESLAGSVDLGGFRGDSR